MRTKCRLKAKKIGEIVEYSIEVESLGLFVVDYEFGDGLTGLCNRLQFFIEVCGSDRWADLSFEIAEPGEEESFYWSFSKWWIGKKCVNELTIDQQIALRKNQIVSGVNYHIFLNDVRVV